MEISLLNGAWGLEVNDAEIGLISRCLRMAHRDLVGTEHLKTRDDMVDKIASYLKAEELGLI